MTAKKKGNSRSKYHSKYGGEHKRDWLSRAFRRMPCMIFLLINCLIFVLVLYGAVVVYGMYTRNYTDVSIYVREANVIDELENDLVSLSRCEYRQEPEEDRVYDQSCLYVRRPNDYLQYHYRLKHVQHWVPAPDERVPICSDILDIHPCHESLEDIQINFRPKIDECVGIGKSVNKESFARFKNSVMFPKITAPAITSEEEKRLEGKTLLANELIVQCPICRLMSKPFTFKFDQNYKGGEQDKNCYVKLSTIKRGRPLDFEFCNAIIKYEPIDPKNPKECEKMVEIPKISENDNDIQVDHIKENENP